MQYSHFYNVDLGSDQNKIFLFFNMYILKNVKMYNVYALKPTQK